MTERAAGLRGWQLLGQVDVSARAYAQLGAAGCLALLQRYADEPEAAGWLLGPGRAQRYDVDGEGYMAVTERHEPSRQAWVTTLCAAEEF